VDRTEMSEDHTERRREPRFSIGAEAVLRRCDSQQSYPATTVNVSAGGLLLKLAETCPFQVGEHLICEVALADSAERALASWGVGRVVRVDQVNMAVELKAAVFSPEVTMG
jgi:c-di-GMP-binding flagellar brake protein YcgR